MNPKTGQRTTADLDTLGVIPLQRLKMINLFVAIHQASMKQRWNYMSVYDNI